MIGFEPAAPTPHQRCEWRHPLLSLKGKLTKEDKEAILLGE